MMKDAENVFSRAYFPGHFKEVERNGKKNVKKFRRELTGKQAVTGTKVWMLMYTTALHGQRKVVTRAFLIRAITLPLFSSSCSVGMAEQKFELKSKFEVRLMSFAVIGSIVGNLIMVLGEKWKRAG